MQGKGTSTQMELIRIGPKLWIVQNDRGEPAMITEDEIEASRLFFEIEEIDRRHRPVKLETQRKRLEGLRKANLVRQRHVISQIKIDNAEGD
jgi:hypothetical protein